MASSQGSGRVTEFKQDTADKICMLLAQGMSMKRVCEEDGMPVMSTVFKWLREQQAFSERYAQAKQESADAMAEDVLDIADNATNDWMERQGDDTPGYQVNGENIQRSKLRVETRKWLMAKMKPKKYGDKLDLDANITGQLTIQTVNYANADDTAPL